MSTEEDTELRDLVTQTLEGRGILAKIKAQLRASIFLALEEENAVENKTPLLNTALHDFTQLEDGKVVLFLIKEFLEFFNLEYTLSVFEPEAFLDNFTYPGRDNLLKNLNIDLVNSDSNVPLFYNIIKALRGYENTANRTYTKNSSINETFEQLSRSKNQIELDTLQSQSDISDSSIIGSIPKPITEIRATAKNLLESNDQSKKDVENLKEKESIDAVVSSQSDFTSYTPSHESDEENSSINDSIKSSKDESCLIDFNKSLGVKLQFNDDSNKNQRNLIDETIHDSNDSFKLQIDRTEKIKPLSPLSSLHDLPPFTLNKSRASDTVLLPSLYTKDFMHSKDTMFDLGTDSLDNYEEDFMSNSEIDFDKPNQTSNSSKSDTNKKSNLPQENCFNVNNLSEFHNENKPDKNNTKETEKIQAETKETDNEESSSISEDINFEEEDSSSIKI